MSSDLAAVIVLEAAKTSSGARRDDTDLRVGSADSREVEGRFERLVIVPFGYGNVRDPYKDVAKQMAAYSFGSKVSIAESIQFSGNTFPDLL